MKKISLLFFTLLAFTAARVSSQNDINDPFFEQVDYIGAFGQEDWTAGWADVDPQDNVYQATTVTVPAGNITTSTTWTANNVYLLNGWVYVKSGATLTIQPGTVIRGDKTNKGTLIIERGAQLIAQGTASQPVVFTSNQPAGSRDYGDWGGIIICGRATVNQPGGEATIEGGVGAMYGGGASPDDDDNSGVLQYVRIEFPGIAFAPNNEINGITFGGVGRGTLVDYVQVSYGGDDSFEFFGGTVNAKHLIALNGWDDDFDTDNGYTGMLQFGVVLRDPDVADVSGSNGFESDNDASGSTNTPATQPLFSNFSFFGPKATLSTTINSDYKRAMHLRRNTRLDVYNSIFLGYPVGLYIDGTLTQANAAGGNLRIRNCIMSGMSQFFGVPDGQTWTVEDERSWYFTQGWNNDTLADNSQLMITDPFNFAAPDFLPLANSPVLQHSSWAGIFDYPELAAAINVYPNPSATGMFEMRVSDLKENVVLTILDLTGRELSRLSLDKQDLLHPVAIDLSDKGAGMYFLGLTAGEARKFVRLVVR